MHTGGKLILSKHTASYVDGMGSADTWLCMQCNGWESQDAYTGLGQPITITFVFVHCSFQKCRTSVWMVL